MTKTSCPAETKISDSHVQRLCGTPFSGCQYWDKTSIFTEYLSISTDFTNSKCCIDFTLERLSHSYESLEYVLLSDNRLIKTELTTNGLEPNPNRLTVIDFRKRPSGSETSNLVDSLPAREFKYL